jgi:hypothetical protein
MSPDGKEITMLHRFLTATAGVLVLAVAATAFEAVGTIRKVDADKGVLYVHAGGQDRTVKVAKDVKVLDKDGKDLPDGLRSKELKEGTVVTLTVERQDDAPVIKQVRLGGKIGERPGDSDPRRLSGKTSVGFKPLTEMTAEDRYAGEDGGLYGGGKNEPPAAHRAAARAQTAKIQPLDADGKPAADGKIVLVSISMSNATQEFSTFKRLADADPDKSVKLTIVDCAQGGQAMAQWVPPEARAWKEAERRLEKAGVTPRQVQVAWIKLANVAPRGNLSEHGKKLKSDTLAVIQNAKAKFPNLRIAYLGSRIYAGHATGGLNPEPYAYESAFVVRWLIQDQIKGEAALNFDPKRGEAKASLLLWGPYFWADGLTPRKSDGLVWKREDLAGDGTHPSDSGRRKVAEMLLAFFKTDAEAKTWFVRKGE